MILGRPRNISSLMKSLFARSRDEALEYLRVLARTNAFASATRRRRAAEHSFEHARSIGNFAMEALRLTQSETPALLRPALQAG